MSVCCFDVYICGERFVTVKFNSDVKKVRGTCGDVLHEFDVRKCAVKGVYEICEFVLPVSPNQKKFRLCTATKQDTCKG